jgi:cyclopropane fatty-acyl-phospholipid synthase-like methyltransferase
MADLSREDRWEARFAASDTYVFGTAPNAFLARTAAAIPPGGSVLSVADGEGRNGVFLAGLGLDVHAVEVSATAIAKAKRLAESRRIELRFEQADLLRWTWPVGQYDAVAAIFVQFVGPDERPGFFTKLIDALKPGGLLLLEGYRPEQVANRTGGPTDPAHCYTEAMLREAFAGLEIERLESYDAVLDEGTGHSGISALIDLVARKPG